MSKKIKFFFARFFLANKGIPLVTPKEKTPKKIIKLILLTMDMISRREIIPHTHPRTHPFSTRNWPEGDRSSGAHRSSKKVRQRRRSNKRETVTSIIITCDTYFSSVYPFFAPPVPLTLRRFRKIIIWCYHKFKTLSLASSAIWYISTNYSRLLTNYSRLLTIIIINHHV